MPAFFPVRAAFTSFRLFNINTALLVLGLGSASQVQALAFNIGELEGQFDSSLAVGASWGLRDADSHLVGISNGGSGHSSTGDDGRLNYGKGQTFSKVFKGVHDLQLKYADSGLFVRGKYWYDFEQQDEATDFKPISNHGREEGARASGAEWLDAFVYHNYAIDDLPGTVRFGKQVVNWGESTFIGNSINSINAVEVSALRRPGAELKEGLLPVNMLFASQALSERLSIEAFYQLQWQGSVVDNCGTFFGSDVVARGCNSGYSVGSPAIAPLQPIAAQAGQGFDVTSEGVIIPRGRDRDARNSGQWGTALRWMGDDIEYGLYFINYHSRTPMLSTRNAGAGTYSALAGIAAAANAQVAGSGAALAQSTLLGNGEYYLEYPEDIHLFGASFATTLPEGSAWSGEVSYRPNAPVQLNTTDLTLLLLGPDAGGDNRGYQRKAITQLQTTLTHFFEAVLGADRLTVVGEAGMVHVSGIGDNDHFGRDAVFGADGRDGFVTANAWGYRAKAILDYPNALLGVNLKPNLTWSHDVDGYGPNGLFNEGAKAVSLGLDGDYQNTYTASLSLTEFFGGRYNVLTDRDYVSMSVGVNF
jgi:hypothetical protein